MASLPCHQSREDFRQREDSVTEVASPQSPRSTSNFLVSDLEKQANNRKEDVNTRQLWRSHLQRLVGKLNSAVSKGTADDEFLPMVRHLGHCPDGYPRLAAYLDSDDNFMIYRRFGYIQARLLLDKQEELRKLEGKLDQLDKEFDSEHPGYSKTVDLKPGLAIRRKTLLTELERTFREYSQLMVAARDLVGLNRPAGKDYRSVSDYMFNSRPQDGHEEDWIHYREDLITLRPGREHAWLDSSIEYLLKWLHCGVVERIFCSKETREKTDGLVVYYTRSRIDKLVVGIIVMILLVLLIVPIYILYHLVSRTGNQRTDALCIGVLLVSTLVFSAILSMFTRARRHEILAAAAGYCAVLVVFLGNVNQGTRHT